MPEENQTGTGQAPAAGQPQAGGTSPQAGDETTGTGTGGKRSLEELEADLAKVRREAAAHRTENAALKKQQTDAEAASLTEAQKVARERDTLKAQLEADAKDRQDTINRYEVKLKAATLGIDPDDAVALLNWETIDYAEDGTPTNVEAALKKLIAAKPYLVKDAGGQSSGAPMNPATGRGAATLTMDQIKKMSPLQIMARFSEVSKVLSGG